MRRSSSSGRCRSCRDAWASASTPGHRQRRRALGSASGRRSGTGPALGRGESCSAWACDETPFHLLCFAFHQRHRKAVARCARRMPCRTNRRTASEPRLPGCLPGCLPARRDGVLRAPPSSTCTIRTRTKHHTFLAPLLVHLRASLRNGSQPPASHQRLTTQSDQSEAASEAAMAGPARSEQLAHPLSSGRPTPRSRRTVLGVPRSDSSSSSTGKMLWDSLTF
jgi:hypothetical protein